MTDVRTIIRDGIAAIITAVDPTIDDKLSSDRAAYLRLIAIAAHIDTEAGETVESSITSARAAGVSWEQIGEVLHISRQAAQQRFGQSTPAAGSDIWRMTPVNAFDEMERLNEAGRHGWHSVAFGTLYHDLAPSEQQWEHRRVSVFTSRHALDVDGWQKVGTMWFPWAYYARPTEMRALPDVE
jgi:hypothetical protein